MDNKVYNLDELLKEIADDANKLFNECCDEWNKASMRRKIIDIIWKVYDGEFKELDQK